MVIFNPDASDVFRDHNTKFIPSSGAYNPAKSYIRTYLKQMEEIVSALATADNFQGAWDASTGSFPSGAQKGYSWIVSTAGTVGGKYFGEGDQIVALVNGASTSTYAGNWVVIPAGTSGVVNAVDGGTGTANAIQVTTESGGGVRDGVLLTFTLFRATTSSPVTVSVDGGPLLTVKANAGANASALSAGQFVVGQVRNGSGELRLLNDQDVSALVAQAEAALAEFEKRYLGAKASDPSVDNEGNALIEGALYWNSVDGNMRVYHSSAWEDFGSVADGSVTNTKLADMATATIKGRATAGTGVPEDLTPAQARDLLDPLRDFAADGTTDDTANFTALRAAYPHTDFDLRGKTYWVTAIPDGPFHNGYFKIENYEGDLSALIPAKGTIDTALTCLAAGPYYAAWPQDKWHEWDGVVYALWTESSQHQGNSQDKHVVMMRSKDGGRTWVQKERLFKTPGTGRWSASAGVTEGVQWVFVRNETTLEQNLWARRLPQRYTIKSGAVSTTSGQNRFSIHFDALPVRYQSIGAIENMEAIVTDAGTAVSVGGIPLDGTYRVTFINNDRIEFDSYSDTATSTVAATGDTGADLVVQFNESPWQSITLGGARVGLAIRTAAGETASDPGVHSFCAGPRRTNGTFYVGVSGTTSGTRCGVAKLSSMFDVLGSAAATVSWVKKISDNAAHVEPTVRYDEATNKFYGFCRTQSPTVGAAFWHADGDMDNVVLTQFPLGAMQYSPIVFEIVDGVIHAFASGNRQGNPEGSESTVSIYKLTASVADAVSMGAAAFAVTVIGEASYERHYGAAGTTSVGVPSVAYLNGTFFVGYSEDRTPSNSTQNATAVNCLTVSIDRNYAKGHGAPQPGQVVTLNDAYWYYAGHPGAANGGYLNFSEEIVSSAPFNSGVFNTSTGFFTPPETGLYEFSGQVCYEDGTAGEKYLQLVGSGDVAIHNVFYGLASNTGVASNECQGVFHFPAFLRAGQSVRFKISAPNGTRNSTARSYLYIKKLT